MTVRKFNKWQTLTNKLRQIGEEWIGNHVKVKYVRNDNPEEIIINQQNSNSILNPTFHDHYTAYIRILLEYKIKKTKVMPVLYVPNAKQLDLEVLKRCLEDAAISVGNVKEHLKFLNENFEKKGNPY